MKNKKIVKSKIKRKIVKTDDNIKLKNNNNNYIKLIFYVPKFFINLKTFYRKVNISTLMVFRNQRRKKKKYNYYTITITTTK